VKTAGSSTLLGFDAGSFGETVPGSGLSSALLADVLGDHRPGEQKRHVNHPNSIKAVLTMDDPRADLLSVFSVEPHIAHEPCELASNLQRLLVWSYCAGKGAFLIGLETVWVLRQPAMDQGIKVLLAEQAHASKLRPQL